MVAVFAIYIVHRLSFNILINTCFAYTVRNTHRVHHLQLIMLYYHNSTEYMLTIGEYLHTI